MKCAADKRTAENSESLTFTEISVKNSQTEKNKLTTENAQNGKRTKIKIGTDANRRVKFTSGLHETKSVGTTEKKTDIVSEPFRISAQQIDDDLDK